MQLLHREFDHSTVLSGPDEARIFQSLLQQPESVAISAQYFDPVLPAVAKDKHGMPEGVHTQTLLDQAGQAIDVLSEIDGIAVQVDRPRRLQFEHGRWLSICMMGDNSSKSASPRSTVTPLGRRTCNRINAGSGRWRL